jgi:hypothetical protein
MVNREIIGRIQRMVTHWGPILSRIHLLSRLIRYCLAEMNRRSLLESRVLIFGQNLWSSVIFNHKESGERSLRYGRVIKLRAKTAFDAMDYTEKGAIVPRDHGSSLLPGLLRIAHGSNDIFGILSQFSQTLRCPRIPSSMMLLLLLSPTIFGRLLQ